jgi:hypothetical protein
MGATTSKNKSDVITEKDLAISQNEYNTIRQSCSAQQSAKNILNLSDIKDSNLTTNQKNQMNNLCKLQAVLKSSKDASALNKTMTSLESNQSTKGGFFAAESDNEQTVRNNLKTNLSQDAFNNVQKECILKQNVDNIINAKRIKGSSISATQENALFNKCLMDYASENNLTAGIKDISETTIKNKQKTEGGALFGGGFIMIIIIIGIVMYVGSGEGGEEAGAEIYITYFILGLLFIAAVIAIIYGIQMFLKADEEFIIDADYRIDKDKILRDAGLREPFSIKESEQAKYFGNNSIKNLKRNSLKKVLKENYDVHEEDRLNTYVGGPGSAPISVTEKSFGLGSTAALKKRNMKSLDEGFRYKLQNSIFGDGTLLKLREDASRQLRTAAPSKTN